MKIAFLCSGLASGQNGVGDYARRLASELIRHGHAAILVALNDTAVKVPVVETQNDWGVPVAVFRLPAAESWDARCEAARGWLQSFQPDYVSLQFVCFGFHPKGLVHGLAGPLARLCGGYRVHWMFHELWVGLEQGQPWRFKPWGLAQRFLVLRLHRRLRPAVTQTTNGTYAAELRRRGIHAGVLPLLGNIPLISDVDWIGEIAATLAITPAARDGWIVIGVFGTIQRQWQAEPWLERVVQWGKEHRRQVALVGIGRIQGPSEAIWNDTVRRYRARVRFHHFGGQPAERVAQYLRYIDCGVATGLASLLGKSGTVASMLEHGKTVLVPCWDLPPGRESWQSGVRPSRRYDVPCVEPQEGRGGDVGAQTAADLVAALTNLR